MQGKELHDFLFQLYDFADILADKIEHGTSDNLGAQFLTLVYIEQIFDMYGRDLISQSAREASLDSGVALSEAHRRIDLLRARIQNLVETHNFNESLRQASEKILHEWSKKSPTSPTL